MIQTQYIIIEREFVLEAGVKVGGKEYGDAEEDRGRINILMTSISVSTLIIRVETDTVFLNVLRQVLKYFLNKYIFTDRETNAGTNDQTL